MTDLAASEPFRSWAIVEIMGHVSLAGELSEQVIAGTAFIRVDVPAVDGQAAFTRLYGAGSIYSITPVDEAIARRAAASMRARPVTVYLQPALSAQINNPSAEPPDPDDTEPEDDEAMDDDDDDDDDGGDIRQSLDDDSHEDDDYPGDTPGIL